MCLDYNTNNPQLFITGGRSKEILLSDAWLLNPNSKKWRKVSMTGIKA